MQHTYTAHSVTGGSRYDGVADTSEYFNIETETFREGPDLPVDFSSHCIVTIDKSRVALIGGYYLENFGYIFDYSDGSFTELPPLQIGRRGHYCGLANSGQGDELIVVGKMTSY